MAKNKYSKDRRLRMLWNSNAPWSLSGYGNNMHDMLPAFVKDGWSTAISCFYGLEGSPIDWNGVKCYPKIADVWGSDAMLLWGKDFKADVTFTHQDIWVLNHQNLAKVKNWIPYLPIDMSPVPPAIVERLKLAYRIVTFTEFGRKELEKEGLYASVIPHGVNTHVFKPMDQKVIRSGLGIPQDAFVFGMVGANKDDPPRKGFQQAMDAFSDFVNSHPEAMLYIHSDPNQQGGFNILGYAKQIGIERKLLMPSPDDMRLNSSDETIAKEYNAMDCLLQVSTNEGFGIPTIEAQSCGVPVIVNGYTALPELVPEGITGEIAPYESLRYTQLGGYVANPSVSNIRQKMESVYLNSRSFYSDNARKWILENYDIEKIIKNKWIPFLEMVQKELLG